MDSQFAIVELMGHQRFGARIQEAELFGIKMLRCEVLTDPPYERDVHPQALYAINRCSEERARLECKYTRCPVLMPQEPVRAELPAPDDIPFDDPDEQEDDSESDEDECDLQEFECEHCKTTLADRVDDSMCIPEHWEAIPFGWSVLTDVVADTVSRFCSPECVRDFLNKTPADHGESDDPNGVIETNEPLTVRCHVSDSAADWYVIECKRHEPPSGRLGIAEIEGTSDQMQRIAGAIDARGSYSFERCAVKVEGERVYLWSPRNSIRRIVVPLAVADALAAEIWVLLGGPGDLHGARS